VRVVPSDLDHVRQYFAFAHWPTGTSARPPEIGMFVMVPIVDNQAPVCKRQATERLDGAREASIE
jgi:hypothetical protein